MSTAVPGPKPSNYKGNSNVEKDIAAEEATPKLKKIEGITVVEKKASIGKRIKDNFGGQTLKSVGVHLLIDVILPNTRDLLYDLATEGAHRSIYGDASSRRRTTAPSTVSTIVGSNRARQTSYNTMSRGTSSAVRSAGDTDIVQRDMFDFSGLVITSRDKAEEVLESMTDAIEEYQTVSVADLYDQLEITGNGFTDQKHGWNAQTFRNVSVQKVRDGWILNLPAPVGLG